MNKQLISTRETASTSMRLVLDRQKAAQLRHGPPSLALRKDRLNRALDMILTHQSELLDAMDLDFGGRSRDMSLFIDIVGAVQPLREARRNVSKWMMPQKRRVTPGILSLLGARSTIRYQPKGVIGIVTSWNFPVQLAMDAVAGAFAAGNRVMLKLSELTPATGNLLAQLFDSYFDEDEAAVFLGDADAGAAFTSLPFDHLIFTGSTTVGRHVMRAAAANLTPVTLELGGKCPVVVSRTANLTKTATRLMAGKLMNAGQVCVAPDYVMVPSEALESFIAEAADATARLYNTIKHNPDYTSVISDRHLSRLHGLVHDARQKGARIVEINPGNENLSRDSRRMLPTLIVDVTDDMDVMKEEIFGPLMPIRRYSALEDTLTTINARPRPLALYYFGTDKREIEALLTLTHSGGVTINDIFWHVAMQDLPFGGIGESGMGGYHGQKGFIEFSHVKAIYQQTMSEQIAAFLPPYGTTFRKRVNALLKG